MEAGSCIRTISGHESEVTSLVYSPSGKAIATGSKDKTIRVWNVETGDCRCVLEGHQDTITSVSYSPKEDIIASGSQDGEVRLWDPQSKACCILGSHGYDVTSLTYSPKGDSVVSSSLDMTLRIWNVEAGTSNNTLSGHNKRISRVEYSPTRDLIAAGYSDGSLELLDAKTRTLKNTLRGGHTKVITSIAFSPKGNLIASSCADHFVRLWDLDTGGYRKDYSDSLRMAEVVAFSPMGDLMAFSWIDNAIRVWDAETGVCRLTLTGHTEAFTVIVLSPDGSQIVTGSEDGTARLWNAETGDCLHTLRGHTSWITSVAYSSSGNLIASGDAHGGLHLWDAITWNCQAVLSGHRGSVATLSFSLKGDIIASGSYDKLIRLWDVDSATCIAAIECFSEVNSITSRTTSSSTDLISGSDDGSVRLWQFYKDDDDQHRVVMEWTSLQCVLNLAHTSIQDARGLSQLNSQLLKQHGSVGEPSRDIVAIPPDIFAENFGPSMIVRNLPEKDDRLVDTSQLAYCLSLLQDQPPDESLEPAVRMWLRDIKSNINEQEQLNEMVTNMVKEFKRAEIKDSETMAEIVCLMPFLDKDSFRELLDTFHACIKTGLMDSNTLEALAQLVQGGKEGYLEADDLTQILDLLGSRIRQEQQQSPEQVYPLTLALSHILDAMADTTVRGLNREKLYMPLSSLLNGMRDSTDSYLVYQTAYLHQALLYIPDNETPWQTSVRRRTLTPGMMAMSLDLNGFVDGLVNIQQGLAGTTQVVRRAKIVYDGVPPLAESGKLFHDCLKESFSDPIRKQAWYPALRAADILIQDGSFIQLKELVCAVPCRSDPAFQWGLCQRLGGLATDSRRNEKARQSAIALLGEIYQKEAVWNPQVHTMQWIINILMQLASEPEDSSSFAKDLLQTFENDQNADKQAFFRSCQEKGSILCPLKITFPEPRTPSLLDRVQLRPDVEGTIRLIKIQRTRYHDPLAFTPLQAKPALNSADDARFPLMEKVKEFLKSEQKVFLLLGDSGSGKSTFNRELEFDLWNAYKKKSGIIPLRISLSAISSPDQDMIAKQLRRAEFTEPEIRELKMYRQFILICDDYDEGQQTHNLYISNRFNQPGEWCAKVIISCRTEYLGTDYQDRFKPIDRNGSPDSSLFQQAIITPFSYDQVNSFIDQYVSRVQPLWRTEDYKQALKLIPSLGDLVKNPFLITLSLEVLPRMVDPGQISSTAHITRVGLYDQFVQHWLERGKKRLGEQDLGPDAGRAFDSLCDEGFTLHGIEFIKRLATKVYKEQDGQPTISYSRLKDENGWKAEFFGRDAEKQIMREACPITRSGNQHRFIHRSLLEYGLALAIFDPQEWKGRTGPDLLDYRRGSTSSMMSFENIDTQETSAATEVGLDANSPLFWRSFVYDSSLLQFLEERAQQEPVFKELLLSYIENSKMDKRWRTAAANAITILVRAGVHFIGSDLRGIQIPKADLSFGTFDSVQLQGADLRRVDLRGVWLRQADLSAAQMEGAHFGELPYLTESGIVYSCAYSPDGRSLVACLENGDINVYATGNREKVMVLQGHTQSVQRAVFSPNCGQIASASSDGTIRLWDLETDTCIHILAEHTDEVNCVAYSPQGDTLASASDDATVRLWDAATGDCRQELSDHEGEVLCVAFSPTGHHVASGGVDSTIRLWDVEAGECRLILIGHEESVADLAYSLHGDQLVSAGQDMILRIWDVETGLSRMILTGHTDSVLSVAFSPGGGLIASGSNDGTVRTWDMETGVCRQILTGHSDGVTGVSYSPYGSYVSSGSKDCTVRLWEVMSRGTRHVSKDHSAGIMSIRCLLQRKIIASGNEDNTVRIWNVDTGDCLETLRGHEDTVTSVAFSPNGETIASTSSDESVKLWDMETGRCQHTLTGHDDSVSSTAFSPDGDLIVTVGMDSTIRFWDVNTGEPRGILTGHSDAILSVAYSPDGTRIATAGKDLAVRLWDTGSKVCCHSMDGHDDWVQDVIFSPRGDQLASASDDMTVRLWSVDSGTFLSTLTGHEGEIECIAYSTSGDLLASGNRDSTVRIWEIASGQCVSVIWNLTSAVRGISWVDESEANLITGLQDGSLLAWHVDTDPEQPEILKWGVTSGSLVVTGASIQDVRNLTQSNQQLLKQRGAIGEPDLPEAAKKVVSMASVQVQGRVERGCEGSNYHRKAARTASTGSSGSTTPRHIEGFCSWLSPLGQKLTKRWSVQSQE